MINNRQAGRRRGRGGQRSQGGGNPGRGPENGNRIDNRARGNAAQLLEKYKTLARDAQMQGDRVNTEYYLQFADHYFRVLAETRSRFEENQPRRGPNDQFEDGDDEDFDGNVEGMADDRVDSYQGDRGNDRGQDRGNDRGERNDRGDRGDRGDRPNGRDAGNRDSQRDGQRDGQRESGNRDGNRANGRDQNRDQQRESGNRDGNVARDTNGSRGHGQRDAAPRDGAERPARRPQVDQGYQPEQNVEAAPAPRNDDEADRPRRGRPRRALPVAETVQHADDDIALDADRLPPSLSLSAIVPDDAEPSEEKPRRRRKAAANEATPVE